MTALVTIPRRYDIPAYTDGWFQVGWSDELARGQLRQLHHFGRKYVLFRGQDGAVGVLDDVCPHLGAHLAEGGCVKGNSVRCPYHHWAFDRTGQCTNIPYSDKIPAKARTVAHTVGERHGMIFMYRNKSGTPPTYALPEIEDFDPANYTRPTRYDFHVKIHGQDIMENSVDPAHFAAVHGHSRPTNEFRQEGRELRITQLTAVHRFGTTLRARLEFHMIEPGFHYVHFPEMPGGEAFVFSSIVPVDEDGVRHRMSLYVKKSAVPLLSPITRVFLRWQMMKTYREDLGIWRSKEYLPHPVLCEGDGSIMKLRAWYRQFYCPSDLARHGQPAASA